MSTLMRPSGVPCDIGGKTFHFLFSISAIDELETKYDRPIDEVINLLSEPKTVYATLWDIVATLIADEVRYQGGSDVPTKEEVGHAIDLRQTGEVMRRVLEAYGISFPEAEEGTDPNVTTTDPNVTTGSGSTSPASSTSAAKRSGTRKTKSST